MEFQWDEKKFLENLRKHGLSFEDADLVFLSPDKITAETTRRACRSAGGRMWRMFLDESWFLSTHRGARRYA